MLPRDFCLILQFQIYNRINLKGLQSSFQLKKIIIKKNN